MTRLVLVVILCCACSAGNDFGTMPTGGRAATGGAVATGGQVATGGAPSTGGRSATGGTTSALLDCGLKCSALQFCVCGEYPDAGRLCWCVNR